MNAGFQPPPPCADPHRRVFRAAGPAPAEPDIIEEEELEESTGLDQPWHVIIFNDPVNLMTYVTMVIQRVFGYAREKAEQMMLDVHQRGKCIVWTGNREQAELYVKILQSHQLFAAMKKAG